MGARGLQRPLLSATIIPTMDLSVKQRTVLGKASNALRKQGLIPAQLYGHGIENKNLSVDGKEFRKVFKEAGENTVVYLVAEDGKKHPVLIHDIQRDSVSSEIDHVDFHEINMNEVITAPIPLEFVGESPAGKVGGVVTRIMDTIEVESLPADLPQSFTVDLAMLAELNQSIYVKDLAVPKNVKVLVDLEAVIATVAEVKEEVIEETPVDLSAVVVESEEKAAERAEKKEAGAEGSAE